MSDIFAALKLAREWLSMVDSHIRDSGAFQADLATIDAALAAPQVLSVGSPQPFAWYWHDATGCLYITGDDRKPEVPAGAKPLYDHPPISSLGGPWLPIDRADRTITNVQNFPEIGINLRNSDRYWVRDADGRVYESSWTEADRDRNYWWDWDAESPVDPVEFMPHPLDPRFATREAE